MRDDRNNGISDSEKRALEAAHRGERPPNDLEDRTVRALRMRGLIVSRERRWMMHTFRTAAVAAVAAVVFVGGMAVGKRSAQETSPGTTVEEATREGNQFMLLLFSKRPRPEPISEERMAEFIEEYRAWGSQLYEQGKLVAAEKLRDDAAVMESRDGTIVIASKPGGGTNRVLGGYFLIRAQDLDEAVNIARSHPHLKYGGEVEVRPVQMMTQPSD